MYKQYLMQLINFTKTTHFILCEGIVHLRLKQTEQMLAGFPAQTSSRSFTFPGFSPRGSLPSQALSQVAFRKALRHYGGRTAQDFNLIPFYRTMSFCCTITFLSYSDIAHTMALRAPAFRYSVFIINQLYHYLIINYT